MEYTTRIKGKRAEDDGYEETIFAEDYPQSVKCPDCGGKAVWAENGNVPGTRKCRCGTFLNVQPNGVHKVVQRKDGYYTQIIRYKVQREQFH